MPSLRDKLRGPPKDPGWEEVERLAQDEAERIVRRAELRVDINAVLTRWGVGGPSQDKVCESLLELFLDGKR